MLSTTCYKLFLILILQIKKKQLTITKPFKGYNNAKKSTDNPSTGNEDDKAIEIISTDKKSMEQLS